MEQTSESAIRNIIFDLGGVLLDLDFQAPVKAFQKLGISAEQLDYRQAIAHPIFLGLETGNISPSDFRDHIRQVLGNANLSDDEIDTAWCSMLGSVPEEKVKILQQLASHYRLFLFSNTNEIHINYFKCRFEAEHHRPVDSLFERTFYSHEIHDRKPLVSSFEKVLQLAGIKSEETLFVDDFEINIENAILTGLQTLHFIPGSRLDEALTKRLGRDFMWDL